ncbi:MAG: carboxypeptidase regulatory-like domain-containing protein [Acidobacteriota bacterium]|nr:carboxypeptidase regulatory-like domain-containing protein [Acidobacteriota bacterium]
MRRWTTGVFALLMALSISTSVFAQGGGASSTGTIQGRVSDSQGAVLPGVTVTATSPSMPGVQTAVSSENGNYRFPAVPPGSYTLAFELAGFNTLRREGIQISLGFTANVNVELALATLQETVTVSGQSPVIDTTATRTVQAFKLDQLQSLPNGRDMWSLLAVTPSVQMGRIDVGGNRAGTQTGYTAYGFSGQVRVLIEGINTTEGTGGAGFYFDYSSLEEVFLGTSGQSAEMPNPGVQSQFIAKSGGNQFSGEGYVDWYNNSLQGSNIPESVIARGIRPHSNEIDRYYDAAINVGGPIVKDKVWYFGTYRTQFNSVAQPQFRFDQTFDTTLWNPVVKGTWQVNQKNKVIGYYQYGQKIQPFRTPFATYVYESPDQTWRQDSGSWVYKGEWNSTVSDKLYLEARAGDFGYYFPLLGNGTQDFSFRDSGLQTIDGTGRRWQTDRDRKQLTLASTYFLDSGSGSHTLKAGLEFFDETQWEGYEQFLGGNRDLIYTNGVSNQVVFGFPTASGPVGSMGARKDLMSIAKLGVLGLFVNDTWSVGKTTVNAGVRYDRYTGTTPEQQQLGGTNGPVTIAAQTFAEREYFTWSSFAPRVGVVYDLSGDGRSVIKANYGLYWHNPGPGLAGSSNANQAAKSATYGWNDANGDRRFQMGEQGNLLASALAGAVSIDPGIKQPFTHEFGTFFEQQLTDTMGARVGFVYKTEDDLWATYRPGRPISAYTVPFTFVDIGVDGTRGTGDDRTLTLLGLPASQSANFPVNAVIQNVESFSRYKTVEAQLNRRYSNRWSASIGGGFTWLNDFPEGFPNNPNEPFDEERTTWNLKASGSYDAMWGIRVSPVLRHQSGSNFARTISVPASAASANGLIYSGTIYAEPANANREDNIWVFDVRGEKTVNFGARTRARLFVDFFNITNSAASEAITRSTGSNYLRPAAILAPRTARLGLRFLW